MLQVLVLTHERASAEETIPYLEWIWWPVPVTALFGRCGPETPRVNKESCVYWGWKEWRAKAGTRLTGQPPNL